MSPETTEPTPPAPTADEDRDDASADAPIEDVASVDAGSLAKQILAGTGRFEHVDCAGVSLAKQRIEGALEFVHCRFTRLDCKKTKFAGPVTFRHCRIEDSAFSNATFEGPVLFEHCQIALRRPWVGITAKATFAVRSCRFEGKTTFEGCKFHGRFDGWDSRVLGWGDFVRCTWDGECDLRSMHFAEGLVFKGCAFTQDVLMRGASVQMKLAFEQTKLSGTLDLQKAKLHDYTYLDGLEWGERATLRVWNAILRAVLVKPNQIAGRLASEREGDFGKATEEYGVLKTNYAGLNWFDEEDWAYYHMKRVRRLARARAGEGGFTGRVARTADWLIFDKACAYGTSPLRVLASSMLTIFGFACLYAIPLFAASDVSYSTLEPTGYFHPYRITGVPRLDGVITCGIGSASSFVSGFDGVDKNVEGWVALALTVESLAGMLLLGLFIVSFSRKVIR